MRLDLAAELGDFPGQTVDLLGAVRGGGFRRLQLRAERRVRGFRFVLSLALDDLRVPLRGALFRLRDEFDAAFAFELARALGCDFLIRQFVQAFHLSIDLEL